MATVEKPSAHEAEHISDTSIDHAVAYEEGKETGLSDAHLCSDADNKRILRKTDIWMLSLLCMVYFLQSADKGIIGLTAVYGLKEDAHLSGNEYSNIGNIGYYAQLGVQPLAAWILVKLRYRHVLPVIITCWGISVAGGLGGGGEVHHEAAVVELEDVWSPDLGVGSVDPGWEGAQGVVVLDQGPGVEVGGGGVLGFDLFVLVD